uniref:helicase associated domain-containing protein n=4 Tax=Mycobacterium avium TaxID=1764 RepID=UPI0022AA69C3|nr:helicase associated domain-containing protein [Mycobacterium avium]
MLGPRWATPREAYWDAMFAALTQFVAQHGHARVPQNHVSGDGTPLGTWVGNQRSRHQQSTLDPARAARLEALPGWVWRDSRADRWERGFAALTQFVAQHGHARVPGSHITDDGHRLGAWVTDQRRDQRKNRLDPARAARLQTLPGWDWSGNAGHEEWLEQRWERGFTALTQFVDEHGHANVASRHTCSDSFHLGGWVSAQRRKHHRGELEDGRAARLEALPGWVWRRRDRTPGVYCGWDGRFAALTQFVDEHGHARVPSAHITGDGIRLGQWVNAQRHTHRQGALDADRAARLEALPGWVWGASGEQRWERGFTALTQFVDEHGHTRVPHGHISADRFRLGQWVNTQRYTYRQGALDPRRTARLQALAGWVWNSDAPGRQVNAA